MGKEKFTSNLYPFIAIAFAKNPKVHTLIDELYNSDKNKYLKLAKSNFWYKSQLIKSYDLITEEFAKKVIGLLEGVSDDSLKTIIQKGWPKFYSWATSVENFKFGECLDSFFYESQDYVEEIIYSVAIIFITGQVLNKTIIMEEETGKLLQDIIDSRVDFSENPSSLHYKNMFIGKNDIYLKIFYDMCNHRQINKNFKAMWKSNDKTVNFLSSIIKYLFSIENLSSDIVESTDLNDNELSDTIKLYLSNDLFFIKESKNFSSNIDQLINYNSSYIPKGKNTFINIAYMIYIRKILKAYKKAKEFYNKKVYENDKLIDDQKRRIVELEFENEILTKKIKKLQTNNKEIEKKLNSKFNKTLYKHISENKKLKETNEKLKNKINSHKKEIQLLLNLNSIIFNELPNETEEIDYDFVNELNVKGIKGVIVGGHPKWQNMIKGYLPNFKFISIDNINFDTALLENADVVFINTKYVSHSLLYKVISAVKNKNIDIHYINCNNKNYVLNKINDIAC